MAVEKAVHNMLTSVGALPDGLTTAARKGKRTVACKVQALKSWLAKAHLKHNLHEWNDVTGKGLPDFDPDWGSLRDKHHLERCSKEWRAFFMKWVQPVLLEQAEQAKRQRIDAVEESVCGEDELEYEDLLRVLDETHAPLREFPSGARFDGDVVASGYLCGRGVRVAGADTAEMVKKLNQHQPISPKQVCAGEQRRPTLTCPQNAHATPPPTLPGDWLSQGRGRLRGCGPAHVVRHRGGRGRREARPRGQHANRLARPCVGPRRLCGMAGPRRSPRGRPHQDR